MPDERFEEHLRHPTGRGHAPAGARVGAAGGAACGDLVRVSVRVEGGTVTDAGFDASGCGAVLAAGSAVVELVRGAPLLEAARVGAPAVAAALGGLSAGKLHAADLAADALHRALGEAAARDAQVAPPARDAVRDGDAAPAPPAAASAPAARHAAPAPAPPAAASGPAAPAPPAAASAPAAPVRTLVAMSGGVDSAVAALLAEGEVVAVTLELWRDPENDAEASCCSASAVRVARAMAHRMGLPHLTLDLRDAFRAGVVAPWLADHAAGLTPNPCVRCNGHVRLDAMLDLATRLGAGALATGHYARRTPDGLLRAAVDTTKDQSYMLAALSPASLERLRFPLGELTKGEVRALAREHGLPVADKPDSQDLCFLAGTGRERFLARHGGLRERPGTILDAAGHEVGRHRGHFAYTVGQRRGLGVYAAEPVYVLATDARANTVTVGPREELLTDRVRLRGVRLHRDPAEVDHVRLRYRSPAVPARLDGDAVVLAEPFAGAAPGQAAVLLRGDVVIGSATIAP